MIMAIWGWSQWSENGSLGRKSRFSFCSYWLHILGVVNAAVVISVAVLVVPSAFQHELVYLDATVTVGGVFATILTIYRKIECWLYWIVINALTFFLYFEQGLTQTALLSIALSLMSVYGFVNWRRLRQREIKYGIIDDE